jgi:hypothetical protein
MPGVEHRRSKYLNNRAENSHQPTRQRERAMKKFTSPGGAQRFLSAFSGISPHFRPRRPGCMLTSTAARWPSDSPPGTRSSACPPPLDPGQHAATSWARTAPLAPKPRQPDSAGQRNSPLLGSIQGRRDHCNLSFADVSASGGAERVRPRMGRGEPLAVGDYLRHGTANSFLDWVMLDGFLRGAGYTTRYGYAWEDLIASKIPKPAQRFARLLNAETVYGGVPPRKGCTFREVADDYPFGPGHHPLQEGHACFAKTLANWLVSDAELNLSAGVNDHVVS